MNSKNYSWAIYAIVLLISLTSCRAMVKSMAIKRITIQNDAIPPDFGKDETTLICVITGKKSYDKHMKKHVLNEYHGKYEFVLRENLDSNLYEDKLKYRYIFDLDKLNYYVNQFDEHGFPERQRITTASYYIIDRIENTTYKSPMTSSFYSKLIQAYMINLESTRRRNM